MSEPINVYLDACCFIDVVKSDVSARLELGRETEVWYIKRILHAHRDREITVFTSVLSIAEAVHTGENPVPEKVRQGLETLLTSGQYVHLVQSTPFVCMNARNLRWIDQIALRGADSVHLASAIDRSCTEFLTMDGRFAQIEKYREKLSAKGILVALPSQTKSLPSKYLQGDLLDDQPRH